MNTFGLALATLTSFGISISEPPPPPTSEPVIEIAQSSLCNRPTRQSGVASYYSDYYNDRLTASGQPFSNSSNQAAHRSLPFGTQVCVKDSQGNSTIVTITDRGPFVAGRVIDLSKASFGNLAPLSQGLERVTLHW
jgi:rare lipoprotein A